MASFYFCFKSNFEKARKTEKNEENPRKSRVFRPASFKTGTLGGANRNRTDDKGFADLCLTAWLWRRLFCQRPVSIPHEESFVNGKFQFFLIFLKYCFLWHKPGLRKTPGILLFRSFPPLLLRLCFYPLEPLPRTAPDSTLVSKECTTFCILVCRLTAMVSIRSNSSL